ncbi:MAG: hypothetical protein DA330_01970 [Nitrososphaera sp.]|nr:hypothetical protein [Nitrososphaera sp.]
MEFIDGDGNIIVPKAVRPIVDLEETILGSKKNANKQYRHGNLHIREYDSHYTVHNDKVDPRQDPIGHLLADAPEYVVASLAAAIVGKEVGVRVYKNKRKQGKDVRDSIIDAVAAGVMAGSATGKIAVMVAKSIKKRQVD